MNNLNYQDKKKEIIQRYADILHDLDMDDSLLKVIDDTLEEIISTLKDKPLRLYDAILSCGENFNAQLIASYNDSQGFKTTYLSPKDAGILVTDLPQQAQILEEAYEKISKLKDIEGKIIIPGFFGVSKNDYVVTFPRGGSDITGAIIARGIRASLYENFTDVSGIYKANPNIINNPDLIEEITYREMRELSYLGLASSMMKHCDHSINTEFQWLLKILIALKIKVHLYAMIEM